MKVLGVNAFNGTSSIASVKNNILEYAAKEQEFTQIASDQQFPSKSLQWLRSKNNHITDYDYIAFADKANYKRFKEHIDPRMHKKLVLVDNNLALAKSVATQGKVSEGAVLINTDDKLILGYLLYDSFIELKSFVYPNSLEYFYNKVTQFLGLSSKTDTNFASLLGTNFYKNSILNNLLVYIEDSYKITLDLENFNEITTLNYDIATSAVDAYSFVIYNLLLWLKAETGSNNLLVFNDNFLINNHIKQYNIFNNITLSANNDNASLAIGAASYVDDILWEHPFLGYKEDILDIADSYAYRLINGEIVTLLEGRKPFTKSSLGTRSFLSIPFGDNIKSIKTSNKINDYVHLNAICQSKDFDDFFENGLTYVDNILHKVIGGNYKVPYCRAFATTTSVNPFINRILEVTKAQGYPILVTCDFNKYKKPAI